MEYVADELGVPVRALPALQRELSVRADARGDPELRRLILRASARTSSTRIRRRPARPGGSRALLARRGRPRAVVHTYHGHVLSGYFSPRSRARLPARRAAPRPLGRSLVAVSDEVRDDLVAFGVAPADALRRRPVRLRPAGVERRRRPGARCASAPSSGVDDGTFVVGWAGRLTAIKRPLDLVRTLRSLVDQGVDAVLVLVGDGEDRQQTEALARELGVADRCRLVGFQQGIRAWYAAFDATLMTSANEGTPVVAIESLAAERPVVATRAGGTATVVTDGESGFLAAIGDIDALAGRLAELARDPELRATARPTGRCGRPRALRDGANGRRAGRGLPKRARPMKVLHIHKLTGVSGSENHLLALLPALRARGIDARFLGLDVPGSDAPRFYERLEELDVPLPAGALRHGRQPADGPRRDPCGQARAARHPAHSPRPCRRLRRGCGHRAPAAVRLDPPQRRPLPARAFPLRRPRVRAAARAG